MKLKIQIGIIGILLCSVVARAEDAGMLDNAIPSSAQANLTTQLNADLNGSTSPSPKLSASNSDAALPAIQSNPETITQPTNPLPVPPTPPLLTSPLATLPAPAATTPVPNADLSQQAFSNMTQGLMPLTPEQIKMLHYLFDQSRKVAAEDAGLPPKPTSSSVVVNLAPGAVPPVIRLAAGFVTSLVFLDSTGAPWPIHAYDIGDPSGFNIQWNKKSNTLLVQATNQYKSGNLAVILKELNTPVMLTLLPGQQAIDYRVDLRVPGLGPNALVMVDEAPGTGDPQLLSVLDGIPPAGAKQLDIQGGECQGWLSTDGHLFLRTRLTVLSPSWLSSMTSADGMHAYVLEKTPVVLTSARGKVVQLTIQGL